MPNFCIDCKYSFSEQHTKQLQCKHPSNTNVDLVTGGVIYWFCSALRNAACQVPKENIMCSKYGELFERKPSKESQELATDMPNGMDIVR